MSKKYKPYLNQEYDKIKEESLKNSKLFEDDFFPANDNSLFKFKRPIQEVFWKRPIEFCEQSPRFIVKNLEPNHFNQGKIGDCWFISALSVLASVPEYLKIVIPNDQSFETNYAGIFRFRFWRFGEWIEIVVDDRLPVDENDELIYCYNEKYYNEMVGPLIEKAYAKLNTCYEFLDGGDCVDALTDFTGGVCERYKIFRTEDDFYYYDYEEIIKKDSLWEILFKSFLMKSLCGALIDEQETSEETLENGLITGHYYSILEPFELVCNNGIYDEIRKSVEPFSSNSVKLIKMRNPWGCEEPYWGKWSNCTESPEWKKVSKDIKAKLNVNNQTNGQFFISLDDFVKNFDWIDFLHVNLNAYSDDLSSNYNWIYKQFTGAWAKEVNAGGSWEKSKKDYWKNPQFYLTINSENDSEDFVSIIISLMQCEQNRKKAESDGLYENTNEALCFSMYSIKNGIELKEKYTKKDLIEIYSFHSYLYQREITTKLEIEPGNYIIIPFLYEKDVEMSFLLRVFIEGKLINEINLNTLYKNRIKNTVKEKNLNKTKNHKIIKQSFSKKNRNKKSLVRKEIKANVLDLNGQIMSKACLIM